RPQGLDAGHHRGRAAHAESQGRARAHRARDPGRRAVDRGAAGPPGRDRRQDPGHQVGHRGRADRDHGGRGDARVKARGGARLTRISGILIVGVGVGVGAGVPAPAAGPDAGLVVAPGVVVTPVPDTLTLVLVGDVGLNRSGTAVDARGVLEGPVPTPWTELSARVAKLIDGDLNFINLETVVTDRNDLHAADKGQAVPFGFRSHPAGVRALTSLGFNLVSAANNHAYDFGAEGARETVRHLGALAAEGRLHFSGI